MYPQEESFEGPRATIREAEKAIAARLEAKLDEGVLVRYAMDRTYTVPVFGAQMTKKKRKSKHQIHHENQLKIIKNY
jgi:hypothetical protein